MASQDGQHMVRVDGIRAAGVVVSAETGEVFRPEGVSEVPQKLPTRKDEDEQDAQDDALLRAASVSWRNGAE